MTCSFLTSWLYARAIYSAYVPVSHSRGKGKRESPRYSAVLMTKASNTRCPWYYVYCAYRDANPNTFPRFCCGDLTHGHPRVIDKRYKFLPYSHQVDRNVFTNKNRHYPVERIRRRARTGMPEALIRRTTNRGWQYRLYSRIVRKT